MPDLLQGVRVLDFGRYIAGPFCSALLADLGAEVIKVEEPIAAERRNLPGGGIRFSPADTPPVGVYRDRNKKALSLNLRNPESVAILKELVKGADVVTENFSPGTMERLGISYEDLKEINPTIIYAAEILLTRKPCSSRYSSRISLQHSSIKKEETSFKR